MNDFVLKVLAILLTVLILLLGWLIDKEIRDYEDILSEKETEIEELKESISSLKAEIDSLNVKVREYRNKEKVKAQSLREGIYSIVDDMNKLDHNINQSDIFEYAKLILKYSSEFDIDSKWIIAMMYQESRFNTNVVSHADAVGLMQGLPSTAKYYNLSREDLFNPNKNIWFGVRYFSDLISRFDGSIKVATIAYNQGEGNVRRGTYNEKYYHLVNGWYNIIK